MSEADSTTTSSISKPSRWRRYRRDAVFVVAIVLGMHWVQTRHVPDGAAPAFSAPAATGGQLSLAEWRERHPDGPVGVYFWADWCGICSAQQASMDGVQADWPVLTVAMQSGDQAAVANYLAAKDLGWLPVAPELVAGLSIPLILFGVWWITRRIHDRLHHALGEH